MEWISVKDRLPQNDRFILIWNRNNEALNWSEYQIGSFNENKFYSKSGINSNEEITHWAELPKPPQP